MSVGKMCAGVCAVVLAATTAQAVSLLPLTPVADETGFGTLYDSLSSPYTGGGFMGTLDSRVYVDALPASQVTFVFDLQVSLAFAGVADMTIAASPPQYDLRISEIIAGINGYVSGTTTNVPDNADAYDNVYPIVDELAYEWLTGNLLWTDDRATLYVTTTGAVDVGEVDCAVQDGGVAYVTVLAPVDDPTSPDLNIPEPASLALLGAGACLVLRRRRS